MAQTFNAAQSMPTMFCCIPLRMGVFLNALFTIIMCMMMLMWRSTFEDSIRVFTGGYALGSRVICHAVDATGCLWGVMGVLGAWNCRASYVQIFNLYQCVRCLAWIGMYLVDVPVMMDCELWITDINKALEKQGWNVVMYNVAMSGHCVTERYQFFVYSSFGLVLFVYLTVSAYKLQAFLQEEPRYLLRIPKDIPSGSFYAQSLGERTQLQARPMPGMSMP